MIGLVDVAWAFPSYKLTAEDYAQRTNSDAGFVRSKTGIECRHLLPDGASEIQLAAEAFRRLQRKTGFSDGAIDLLVYISQNPDRTMPHGAAQLLADLNFQGQPPSFDIALGCSAFPYALSICRGLMESQGWNTAVVVTNEPLSRITTLAQQKTAAHFGDAATATLLQRDTGGAIGYGNFGTDGSQWEVIHMPKRSEGMRRSHLLDDPPVPYEEAHSLRMNGAALASFFSKKVPESIDLCLQKNGIEPSRLDLIVLHQASQVMLNLLKERLALNAHVEIPIQLKDGGNTGSSSIPLTLGRLMEEGSIHGKNIVLTGFGVGLSWGTILLKF